MEISRSLAAKIEGQKGHKFAEMVRCIRDPEENLVLNAGKPVISVWHIILKL